MKRANTEHSPGRTTMLRWAACLGAVTPEALALHERRTLASARGRLLAAERAGLMSRWALLADAPSLYTVTAAGVRAAGVHGVEPGRVSVAGAPHAIACAWVAAALECAYPEHSVMGERELRRDERECGASLASARLGDGPDGAPLLHRPDLVLWPKDPRERLPVAVEVELTIKAPRRLREICRAWARCRCVAGTLYLAAPEVQSALARAIDGARAGERIALVAIDALDRACDPAGTAAESTVAAPA
jgi:hypothetical protein